MLSTSEAQNTGFSFTTDVVLSVVILGDFAEKAWISRVFLKRFFWVEDKEALNLSQNRKKRYNGRHCLKIVGATAESLKRVLKLN